MGGVGVQWQMKAVKMHILKALKMWEEVQRVLHLREVHFEYSQKVEDSKGCLRKATWGRG